MSIRTVVTRGFGSFGTIPFVTTRGYGAYGTIPPVNGPLRCVAATVYRPGLMRGAVMLPGAKAADVYRPGAMEGASIR